LRWSIFDILRSAMLSEQRVSLSRLVFEQDGERPLTTSSSGPEMNEKRLA
jgi:hypothetical protein